MQEELRAQLSAADLHKLLLSLMDCSTELVNGPVPDTPPQLIPDTPLSAELEAESVPSSAVPSSLPLSVTQLHFENTDEGTGGTDAICSSLGPTEFATPSAENSLHHGATCTHNVTEIDGFFPQHHTIWCSFPLCVPLFFLFFLFSLFMCLQFPKSL